jgi:hypothetical protein
MLVYNRLAYKEERINFLTFSAGKFPFEREIPIGEALHVYSL